MNKTKIIALTEAGFVLAKKLHSQINNSEAIFKPKPFTDYVQSAFQRGDTLIMICATGIVMRTLAPVIANKHQDPPVLVLDELGKFVIPLLSGHEGGANELAEQVSHLINAQNVQTTAKAYLKPVYTLGFGCERNCPIEFIEEVLDRALIETGLSLAQIETMHSIDIKDDEVALIALAKKLGKDFICFDKTELAQVEPLLSKKSDYIYKTVGVYGVAESAALLSVQRLTGNTSELVLNKIKNTKATCAIARSFKVE